MLTPNEHITIAEKREADPIRLGMGQSGISSVDEQAVQKEAINNLLNHYYMKELSGWESFMSELEFE